MSWTIPAETRYSFKRGSRGIVVWAIQRNLNNVDSRGLLEDGMYGRRTEAAVATFQEDHDLFVDGIHGPASSLKMARVLEFTVSILLPHRLIEGFVEGESAGHVGAVNWSSPGGVDCSYLQRRVLNGATDATKERAFDGAYQYKLLARTTRDRYKAFLGRPGAQTHERAWRLAALHHNYQYAADKLSRGPWQTAYATSEQEWVVNIGAHFEDGSLVTTPLEWCTFYCGFPQRAGWPGHVTKHVTDWNP
jgi:peptidoglycan hydrolase-like protein with peptidoglycan-binding domain